MQDLNKFVNRDMINHAADVKLKPLEMLALYTMIDATDSSKELKATKNKIELVLKSYITYILRDCEDIAKHYDYNSLLKEKSVKEANELLDIIVSELSIRKDKVHQLQAVK